MTEGNSTMTANAGFSGILTRIGLFMMVLLMATISSADCMKDLSGEVYCGAGRCLVDSKGTIWCSRHFEGDAKKTLDGQVLCGKGQCAKGSDGQIVCSSEIGGAVLIDSRGHVRCYGNCEPATTDHCENPIADSADK